MNIAGLYRAMDEALPEQVNLEEKAGRLYFCLYRFHEWPDYTLFWIPIDFIEKISVPVRCIVREFIRRFIRHHGLNMVKETWYYELALEELRDWKNRDPDASSQEVRRNSLLAESYDNGKISKALKRMEGKPFCVRLEDKNTGMPDRSEEGTGPPRTGKRGAGTDNTGQPVSHTVLLRLGV